MTVERTEKYEFCSVKQNTVEEFEFECSRCGQKFSLKSDTSVVKATTRPRSAIRNVIVALSFFVSGQYFKDHHKILWTLLFKVWTKSIRLGGSTLLNGLRRS